jgi:hypothetical protein
MALVMWRHRINVATADLLQLLAGGSDRPRPGAATRGTKA